MTTEKATAMLHKAHHFFQIALGVLVMAVFGFQGIRGIVTGHIGYGIAMLAVVVGGATIFKVARQEYKDYKNAQKDEQ